MNTFPIDLGAYQHITLNASNTTLTDEQRASLKANIQLCRDAIAFLLRPAQREASADIPAAPTIPCRKS